MENLGRRIDIHNLRITMKGLSRSNINKEITDPVNETKVSDDFKSNIEKPMTSYTFDGVFNPDAREFSITEVKEKRRFNTPSIIEVVSREESRR